MQLMKQHFFKPALLALVLAFAAPATLFAQDDNGGVKSKDKGKKQQIVITRTGDETGKTVIEIDGDKVKINGKEAADLKDVNVHINNLKASGDWFGKDFNFNYDFDRSDLFSTDSSRAMLGVVTDGDDKGAEIQSVNKGSAAEKAGLKKGDIITKIESSKIGSRKIETTDDVTDAVRAHKPGDKVGITYLRNGKEQNATAELGRWRGMNMTVLSAPKVWNNQVFREQLNNRISTEALPYVQGFGSFGRQRLGLSVQDTDDGKGVKVLEVEDEGSADKAGVKEGDIITTVDDKAVNSADEVAQLMREKRDRTFVKIGVTRDGKTQTLNVRMKQPKTVDL